MVYLGVQRYINLYKGALTIKYIGQVGKIKDKEGHRMPLIRVDRAKAGFYAKCRLKPLERAYIDIYNLIRKDYI